MRCAAFAALSARLAAMVTLIASGTASASGPLIHPGEWKEDFESGTTAAWESYPPFEDTAYDFTLYPARLIPKEELRGSIFSGGEAYPPSGIAPPVIAKSDNEYYLLRALKPAGTFGGKFGMWCATHRLLTSQHTEVAFQYWLEDRNASPTALRVQLAGGDGRRYVTELKPRRRAWTSVTIPANRFREERTGAKLPPGIAIDAVAIFAESEESDPTAYVYLGIDNVEIDGSAPDLPEWGQPAIDRHAHWEQAFARSILAPSQPLALSVRLPDSIDAAAVTLSFGVRPEEFANVPLVKRGDSWQLPGGYTFRATDPLGPWTAQLHASTTDGRTVEDAFRFWRLAPASAERPRLLFGPTDLEALRTRAAETNRGKAVMAAIRKGARAARERGLKGSTATSPSLDAEFTSGSLPPEEADMEVFQADYLLRDIDAYYTVLRTPSGDALNNALVYLVDGDESAGRYAKQVMLRLAGWKSWLHPNFQRLGRSTYYPVGMNAMYLALAYDMVYPLLGDDEKAQIREGIHRNAIRGAWEEYFLHRRVANGTSNWTSGTCAAPLLAILAMYERPEDFPPEFTGVAEAWLAHLKLAYPGDGSYGEGQSYHSFATSNSAPTMEALAHAYGVDRLGENSGYTSSALFTIYVAVGDKAFIDMGDGENEISTDRPFGALIPLAHASRDPVLNHFIAMNPGTDWRELVWPLDAQAAAPPEQLLPPSRVFEGKGSAILRTSWSPDGIALHYRAGPNFNHTHADQGNFLLWGHGELLAGEGGMSMYYDDPYFWSYFSQAGAHNVLLVDGNLQSQETGDFGSIIPAFDHHARILSRALTDNAGVLRSDLQPVYERTLSKYERKLAFTPLGDVVMVDTVESSEGPLDLCIQYHPPIQDRTTVEGRTAVYQGEKATLTIESLFPEAAELRLFQVPTPIRELRAHPRPPAHAHHVLRIGSPRKAITQEFVTAYLPAKEGAAPSPVSPVDTSRGRGVALGGDGARTLVLYGGDGVAGEAIDSDASLLMSTGDRIWLLDATHLTVNGAAVWHSSTPWSGVLERREGGWASLGDKR
jgi:hypothetical protein